jgi:hypothetical protein
LDNGAGDIALRNSDQAVTEQEPGLQFIDPQIGATERHVCLKAWPKPSGSGRVRRAGAACPSDFAAPLHALRAMVSEASTRANQRFATGTVQHLKPSIKAVN